MNSAAAAYSNSRQFAVWEKLALLLLLSVSFFLDFPTRVSGGRMFGKLLILTVKVITETVLHRFY